MFKACALRNLLLAQGKYRTNAPIFQNGHPHFYIVVSTTCGTVVKQNGPRDPFSEFWEVEVGLKHF